MRSALNRQFDFYRYRSLLRRVRDYEDWEKSIETGEKIGRHMPDDPPLTDAQRENYLACRSSIEYLRGRLIDTASYIQDCERRARQHEAERLEKKDAQGTARRAKWRAEEYAAVTSFSSTGLDEILHAMQSRERQSGRGPGSVEDLMVTIDNELGLLDYSLVRGMRT